MDNNNPAPIAAAPVKSGKGAVIGMVICSILALAGVGFGVYGMMNKPATQDLKIQVKDTDGEITTIDASKIEKTDGGKTITIADGATTNKAEIIKLAGNVVMPYLKARNGYLNSIFDEGGLSDGIKFAIVTENGLGIKDGSTIWPADLDEAYTYYFDTVAPKGFSSMCSKITLGDVVYTVEQYGCGGAGLHIITAIKDARLEDGKLVVEVYYTKFGNNESDAFLEQFKESDDNTDVIVSADQIESKEGYGDYFKTYTFTFKPVDDHYAFESLK